MKRIIYTVDGQTRIVIPAGEPTSDEELTALAEQLVPSGVPYRIVDATEIPTDRYFRNAWKDDLSVDMVKARNIHRDKLRALRAPKLDKLDVEYMRADEAGDAAKKTDIATKKQQLRDVTADPAIEAAATPEDLKAVRPAILDQV